MAISNARRGEQEHESTHTLTEPRYATCLPVTGQIVPTHERYRKPAPDESGLKTLKRIALLGQDYVDRFFFGATPLAKSSH